MSAIEIDIIRFNEGGYIGHWGIIIDVFPLFATYNADGERLIHWDGYAEGIAAHAVNAGTASPTAYAIWAAQHRYEIAVLDSLQSAHLRMLLRVAEQLGGYGRRFVFCMNNISMYEKAENSRHFEKEVCQP